MLPSVKMVRKLNKKGISVMIGYVLLISIAVILSIIVYQWLKTYVPSQALECPAETSVFIKSYSCESNKLNITIRNNGNFNVAGYFIRASTEPDEELASTDLSTRLDPSFGGTIFQGNSIIFVQGDNGLSPNEETENVFDVSDISQIYFIDLIPTRFQTENNRIRFVTCTNQKISEEITCT